MSVVFYEQVGGTHAHEINGKRKDINNEICANQTVPKGIQGRGLYLLDYVDLDMIQHLPYKYMINIDGRA